MKPSRPPRRVLMTADTIGGVWEYALDLCRSLAENEIEVTLATMGRQASLRQRWEAERIQSLTLQTSSFKLEWMPDAWHDVEESGQWLLELEDVIEPDLVHLNGLCHGALPWSAPVLTVVHSCVLSWWESVKGASAPAEWKRYRHESQRGLHGADRVVAPSRTMAESTQRLYGLESVTVIPNGRDGTSVYSPRVDKQQLILAAGRLWDDAKNLSTLDRACRELTWPLYLAGPTHGPFDNTFVPENGIALGALSPVELATWMRQASIYALPAKYEPFGLSVLEAALCGCALVLGDIPSLRENWGTAALFVPPDDERGLADALEMLTVSPEMRGALATRARQRAAQFTAGRMAASYLTAYSELLGAAPTAVTRLAAHA